MAAENAVMSQAVNPQLVPAMGTAPPGPRPRQISMDDDLLANAECGQDFHMGQMVSHPPQGVLAAW